MLSLEELTKKTREKFAGQTSFPEVNIPISLKKVIENLIFNKNNTKAVFYEKSFVVETSVNHFSIIPNQYLFLATECYELVRKLKCLFDFFDLECRNNKENKIHINEIQDKISKKISININTELKYMNFSSLDHNIATQEDFFYLVGNLKDNKKFGNLEKNTLRTSEDLLGSYVLNIVPLTTAASGYFGTLVYTLANDFDLYKTLCNSIELSSCFESTPSTQTPTQIIFYGVPGSGKSHSIKKELAEKGITDLKEQTKRVVFHPEYTNADFVGQILPQSSDNGESISYPFVPGPFTQILAKAYTHKNTHYALIIEEINRGNAAAIFGELFQLLDRLDEDETESSNEVAYTKGWSSYSINNDNINKAIQEAYNDSNIEPFINKEIFDTYKLNIGIRLPPNLSIFATMNTSDQNVFKLDNAFKRRWKLRLIPNKFKEKSGPEEINQRDAVVEGFDFTWNNFREAVNSIIIDPDNSIDISSFADRQIGCWFTKAIKKDEKYIIEKEVFVHKVLEYLWDDVCNGDIGIFFNEKYKSFAELVEDVSEKGITDIFSENLKGKLSQNKPE